MFPRTDNPKNIDVTTVVTIGMCVLGVLLLAVGLITYTTTKRHTESQMGRSSATPVEAVPEEAAAVRSSLQFSRMYTGLLNG